MRQIGVTRVSTLISEEDLARAIAAMQVQVTRDFAPIWKLDANLFAFRFPETIPAGMAQIIIADDSDQANALGYHELTANGYPIGFVFVKSDIADGVSWSTTFSHELLELLVDPAINLVAEVDHPDGSMTMYSYEVCDACEDQSYAYPIVLADGTEATFTDGSKILASDFVTPEYFESPASPDATFDAKGFIKAPLEILPGGYMSILEVGNSSGWKQVQADMTEGGKPYPPGSRRARRRMSENQWRRSER